MTIYDIARIAGVSTATVSRVVNNTGNVSKKTRQRVLNVIHEANYTPNVFARGMGTNSMRTIGILCADIAHPFMAKAVSLLQKPLHEHGYDCILSCTGLEHDDKLEHIQRLLSKSIDALVLIGSKYEDPTSDEIEPDYIAEAAKHIPVFLVNGHVPGKNVFCTYSNDFEITREVTRRFIAQGRQRILFLSDFPAYCVLRRLHGYEAALQEIGITTSSELEVFTRVDVHYTRDVLFEHNDLKFDAVVATEDDLAIGALKYALLKGLSIPKDIAICGFNNTHLSISSTPELTSVDNRLADQCQITVDNLLIALESEVGVGILHEIKLPAQIVSRETTNF
jgi:LacI family transcriptional regulator/LacI family asc operon transcriptional repressor